MNTTILAIGVAGIAAAAFFFVSLGKRRGASPGAQRPVTTQVNGNGYADVVRHGEPSQPAPGSPGAQIQQTSQAVGQAGAAIGGLVTAFSGLFGSGGSSDGGGFGSDASGASLDAGGVGGDAGLAAFSGGNDGTGNYDFGGGLNFGGGTDTGAWSASDSGFSS